jgi:hypothetical protein
LALQILSIVVFQSINVFAVTQIAAHFVRAPDAASIPGGATDVEAGGEAGAPRAVREASADRPAAARAEFPVNFPREPKVENRKLENGNLDNPGAERLETLRTETGNSLETRPTRGLETGNLETSGATRLEAPGLKTGNSLETDAIPEPNGEVRRRSLRDGQIAEHLMAARNYVVSRLGDNKTTQRELSSLLGISKRDLSLLLNFDTAEPSRRRPSRNAILAILEHFGPQGLGAGQ